MRARLGCWAVQDTTGRNGIEPKKSGSQVSGRIWDLDALAVHLEGNGEKTGVWAEELTALLLLQKIR